MRQALALAAGLVLVWAGLALGQENTGLDRLTTREDLRGWEPVGRVDIEEGGFCTGALIAPDLVLTAGHCIFSPDGTPVPAERITFRAGFADGVSLAESGVLRTIAPKAFRLAEPTPPEMILLDVALLELADPIPTSVISPFTLALPGTGDEVSVVSYAAGREDALSWQRVCQVLAKMDGLIAVDCDVTFGASGAPVLDRTGYRAKIVSIISVGSEWEGRRIAVGMELPGVVADLKAALARGEATSKAGPDRSDGVAKRVMVGEGNGTGAKFVTP